MARTKSYVKAEVLEVLEADEGGDYAEIEPPQSPSLTGSGDDSVASVESTKKGVKMPERQVVAKSTLAGTSPSSGTLDSTMPLVATRLKRARSVDHSTAKLPDAVRRSNIRAVMESSDDRDPDKFLRSNDFDRTNAKRSSQDPTTKVRRSTEQEIVRHTATGESAAHKRSKGSSGSTEFIVIVINRVVVCESAHSY